MSTNSKGVTAAAAAFSIWGLFPLYFHLLLAVSPLQIIAHRVVWSCLFVFVWMAFRGELGAVRAALGNRAAVSRLALTAALITVNWVVYVWAVAHGQVLEGSLGYFIGPLVNVLLGVVLLSERLTPAQWTSVSLAAAGVAYLTFAAGRPPWIALTLAVSFAFYGLLRKVVKVEALPGLATETLLLVPLAAGFLIWCEANGTGSLGHSTPLLNVLMIGAGPITAITLYLYAYGTRLIPYSTVGLLQYIAPTGQFLCGVWILHEPFDKHRAIGFVLIWTALFIYAGDGVRQARRLQRAYA